MLEQIKKLLGFAPPADFKKLIKDGAVIIDVRTREEFQTGHIKGALNLPLPLLNQHLQGLSKNKPIITCCASGMRSAAAKSALKAKGYTTVYNGGGWMSLNNKIR